MIGTALVTGATGFIGSHLTESLLADGWKVVAAVRRQSRLSWLQRQAVEIRRVEFSEVASWSSALAGIDTVFHLAGAVAGTAAELRRANGEVTAALAEACALSEQPPTMILVSSLSAAGPSSLTAPRRPTEPPAPVSEYGRSKLAGELAALRFANRMPVTILRPGIVFGPRDKELARLFAPIHRLRINPLAGFHDPQVSFVHVQDFVAAIRSAQVRGTRCTETDFLSGKGIYFVADPQTVSFAELGDLLAAGMGHPRVNRVRIPLPVARFAAIANTQVMKLFGQKTTFNPDKICEASAAAWSCNIETTMSELQWYPTQPIRERLLEFARQYRQGKIDV